MALPSLTPSSTSSKSILPSTGSAGAGITDGSANASNYPIGLYTTGGDLEDTNFMSGAADQVAYVFKKLGGDVLDIELTPANVYSAYEESVLEYSYQINLHQSKNIMSNVLGQSTASFDHEGQIIDGDASGSNVNLKYPKFKFTYSRRIGEGIAEEAGFGGNLTEYSASFNVASGQAIYDLQQIVSESSATGTDSGTGNAVDYNGLVGNNKVRITRVYYKTPLAMWRFFGYYGGINVIGNMQTYGQFADDSTFEIIPAWQNKMQAMAYEDHIHTRISHYSYEIINNKLTLYPPPTQVAPGLADRFFFKFTIETDAWEDEADKQTGADGINNINSIPFDNLPYKNINAIGKHWIRRYALALSKEMLGQIRGKFGGNIPIPGDKVTLNSGDLLTQAGAEKTALIEELKKILEETTYLQLMKNDAELLDANGKILEETPSPIFVG